MSTALLFLGLIWLAGAQGAQTPKTAPKGTGGDGVWVTVRRDGADGEGFSSFQRFELTPDGQAVWETSATGYGDAGQGCGAGGGRFKTQAGKADAEEIGRAALAALKAQPADPRAEEDRRPGDASLSVFVRIDHKASQGEIVKGTPDFEKLERKISALRGKMDPQSAVLIRVTEKEKGLLSVRFTLGGDRPFSLMLPPRAEEAFTLSGYSVEYVKAPAQEEALLTKEKPSLELELKYAQRPGKEKRERLLRYSNRMSQHHLTDEKRPTDLNLCSRF